MNHWRVYNPYYWRHRRTLFHFKNSRGKYIRISLVRTDSGKKFIEIKIGHKDHHNVHCTDKIITVP